MNRPRALRKLKHAMLYIDRKDEQASELLRQKYIAVRGKYDFRASGHNGKCCDKYRHSA